MTQFGSLLYGRGSIDDKGSIASVLYAMKSVRRSGLSIESNIRLMIETAEETCGDGMNCYRRARPAPRH